MARTKKLISRSLADALDRLAHQIALGVSDDLRAAVLADALRTRPYTGTPAGERREHGRGLTVAELTARGDALFAFAHNGTTTSTVYFAAIGAADMCRVAVDAMA